MPSAESWCVWSLGGGAGGVAACSRLEERDSRLRPSPVVSGRCALPRGWSRCVLALARAGLEPSAESWRVWSLCVAACL